MLTLRAITGLFFSLAIRPCVTSQLFSKDFSFNPQHGIGENDQAASYNTRALQKDAFLDTLVANMTVLELGELSQRLLTEFARLIELIPALQLQLMFADSIIGPNSDNALWGLSTTTTSSLQNR
jgi:hypothetical protein